MKCPRCGAGLADGSAICILCGTVFKHESPRSAPIWRDKQGAGNPQPPAPAGKPAEPPRAEPQRPLVYAPPGKTPPATPKPASTIPEADARPAAPVAAPPPASARSAAAGPVAGMSKEKSEAAVAAVKALSSKFKDGPDWNTVPAEHVSKSTWRPGLGGMLAAVFLISGIAAAYVYVVRPPANLVVDGSLTTRARSFALKPPAGWTTLAPEALADAAVKFGGRLPEAVKRTFGHTAPPDLVLLKPGGDPDMIPFLVIRALEQEPPPLTPQEQQELTYAFSLLYSDLYDWFTLETPLQASVDGLPALMIRARASKRLLATGAETVYREVDGGFEVAGRTDEVWRTLKPHFTHHVVRGAGTTFLITAVTDESRLDNLETFKGVISTFRALRRPPLLDPEPLQLFKGVVVTVGALAILYLFLAIAALVKARHD